MTNKKQEQRNSRAIIILSVIVTLLIGVLIASICMQGFTELDPFGLFADKQEDPSLSGGELPGGDIVIDPEDPNANMIKLSVMPTAAVASSAEDEKTKVLTVTVEPADAPQEVDWAIAFVDPASTWATGKTVTDYVTVTPTSDGSKTATVKCLQAFGEDIKVTVSARSDASKNATCTVLFKQGVTVSLDGEKTVITEYAGLGVIVKVQPSSEPYTMRASTDGKMVFIYDPSFLTVYIAVLNRYPGLAQYSISEKLFNQKKAYEYSNWAATCENYNITSTPFYFSLDKDKYIPVTAGTKDSGFYLLHDRVISKGSSDSQMKLKELFSSVAIYFPGLRDELKKLTFSPIIKTAIEAMIEIIKEMIKTECRFGTLYVEVNGQHFEFPVSDCKDANVKRDIQTISERYNTVSLSSVTVNPEVITFGG